MRKNFMKTFLLFLVCLAMPLGLLFSAEAAPPKRILIGAPIHQKPAILHQFLESLKRLDQQGYTADYFFIDDNEVEASSFLLNFFAKGLPGRCLVIPSGRDNSTPQYICDDNTTHFWKDELLWRVAAFKDRMIEQAREKDYDYLFLIDSDIVLHPKTIQQLIKCDKDIVSNIFWTSWQPGTMEMPQVWLTDFYTQYEVKAGETLTPEQTAERIQAFYAMLRQPGTYEVGGLGACTLLSKKAVHQGISFKKIKNLTLWGEDRHFCVRAAALDIPLFVDTHLPAYHIYRESALPGVAAFIQSCEEKKSEEQKPYEQKPARITLSMVMKNEGDRYLRRVLDSAKAYISDAVIIDDASTDNSVEVCKEVLQGIPLHLVINESSKFSNEYKLRTQQWEETLKVNPEWILVLDADEIFEKRFADEVKTLVTNPNVDAYYFRLYDLWDENHYRDDAFWQAHKHYRPFLVRHKPDVQYHWKETPQHCGRFPLNVVAYAKADSDLRLKHYGWAKPEDRQAKYERYMTLDPGAKYGWQAQYDSILDAAPSLATWEE